MFFGDLGTGGFIDRLWRRRPGKASVYGTPFERVRISDRAFLKAIKSLRATRPSDVVAHGGTTFVQELDRAYPEFNGVRDEIAERLGCASVWIDAVRAGAKGSIGAHFDHSDNFVVQQFGTKIWRVAPPDSLTEEEIALRMTGATGVGGARLPDEFEEFELKRGEVLYIPLFWIHHGISSGRSLSLSVVCNAAPAMDAILESIKDVIAERKTRWSPLPIGAQGPEMLEAVLFAAMSDLHDGFASTHFCKGVVDRWSGRVPTLGSSKSTVRNVDLHIDLDRVGSFIEARLGHPDLTQLVIPSGPTASTRLRAMTARVFAKRFFLAASRGWILLSNESQRQIQQLVQIIEASDDATLEQFFVRPEITSWIMMAAEAAGSRHVGRFREICSYSGSLFLPLVIALRESVPDRQLPIRIFRNGLVHLLPYGLAIDVGRNAPAECQASVEHGMVTLRVGADRYDIPAPPDADGSDLPPCVHVLQFAADGAFLILDEHEWFSRFWPSGTETTGTETSLDRSVHTLQLRNAIDEGAFLVREHWPEAMADMLTNIVAFSPLVRKEIKAPDPESIPAFRGLVRTSAQPSYLSAQMLVRECAHSRLNSVMDVFDLVEGEDSPLRCPFVQSTRPATVLLRGAVSFLNEVELVARLIGHVEPVCKTSMERYLMKRMTDLRQALATMQQFPNWTAEGGRVVAGCVGVYGRLAERYM
jgi:HEXXH motif-containing protein